MALRNEFAKERSAMVDRVAKEIGINIFQGKGPGCPVERPRRCPATGMTVMPDGPQPERKLPRANNKPPSSRWSVSLSSGEKP